MKYAAAIILSLLAPIAAAGYSFDGPVILFVEDEKGSNCSDPTVVGCLFSIEGESIGNATVDLFLTYQNLWIGTNYSWAALPADLVPANLTSEDVTISSEGDDTYVRFSTLREAFAAYNNVPQDRPHRDAAGLTLSSENVSVYYFGPSTKLPGNANRSVGMDFGEGAEFDQIGPVNNAFNASSDGWLAPTGIWCKYAAQASTWGRQFCDMTWNTTWPLYVNETPNVQFGLQWENVTATTNASALPLPPRGPPTSNGPEEQPRSRSPLPFADPDAEPPLGILSADASAIRPPRPSLPDLADAPRTYVGSPPPARLPPPAVAPELPPAAGIVTAAVAILAVLGASLYSRFARPEDLLHSRPRQLILDEVQRAPGRTVGDLQRILGVTRTAILYHVAHLERAGLVAIRKEGRAVYLVATVVRPDASIPMKFQADPTARAFVQAPEAAGAAGLPRSDLHRLAATVPRRTRNHVIAELERSGIISTADPGRLAIRARA